MYLANGRLLYGHKPLQLSAHIKRVIDQGLLSDLPHRYRATLLTLCQRIFGKERHYYFFSSAETVRRALRRALRLPLRHSLGWSLRRAAPFRVNYLMNSKNIVDPAYLPEGVTPQYAPFFAYYRARLPLINGNIIIPLLPFPYPTESRIVASAIPLDVAEGHYFGALESVAAIHLLSAMQSDTIGHLYSDKRKDIIDPREEGKHKKLAQWKSNGNYLHSSLRSEKYKQLYHALLEHDILINPLARGISVLPPQIPKKEYLKFIEVSATI